MKFARHPRAATYAIALAVVLMLARAPASAQESQPADPLAAIAPSMRELRLGTWDAAKARTVIETLIAAELPAAAAWWVAAAEDAIKATRLPASFGSAVTALRKKCETEGATADDRKLVLKLLRHCESLASSRNFDEAKTLMSILRAAARLAPDAAAVRALDAVEVKITAGSGDADPSNLPRQKKAMDEMRRALTQMVSARLDRLEAEYGRAGCRAGRRALEAAIRGVAPLLEEGEADTRIRRLRVTARGVEPAKALTIAARADGPIRAALDGEEVEAADGVVTVSVIAGDLLQLSLPRYSVFNADGKTALHVAAVAVKLDGTDIGRKHLFVNAKNDADVLDPPLEKFEFRRAQAGDTILTDFKRDDGWKHGAFVAKGPDGKPLAYDVRDSFLAFESEFKNQSLPFVWVGGIAQAVVIVVKVPEE